MYRSIVSGLLCLALMVSTCKHLLAHNGNLIHAYPLQSIKIDGKLDDWPANISRHPISYYLSDTKAKNEADFSGYFQAGYRMQDRSLYVAFIVRDDDFIEDTSNNVSWQSQDGLELCIDGYHARSGSGVASFMYSKKLRNINKANFDPFAKNASWEIMEVAMTRKGDTRYYEWKIRMGDHLQEGKTVGFDFLVFDKDNDGSFSFAGWGPGDSKYRNPNSLGDIIIMKANEKTEALSGQIEWNAKPDTRTPRVVQVWSKQNPLLWTKAFIDSTGKYTVNLPAGKYNVGLPYEYYINGTQVYSTGNNRQKEINVVRGGKNAIPTLKVDLTPAPDLIPEKGILHDFVPGKTKEIDHFIETYQKYYNIPGVSLAIIKDGKMVYHKTYGVRNAISGEKVDNNTLFEAASITKPVFSFAVLRLAEQGVIDLDKPLYTYLPYEDIAHDERYKLITARHVLTHRTGFPNWRSMNPDGKLDLKFEPGTDFGYSGEGFEYLKLVVQKITGKKVEEILQKEVIEPMGLYHTFFSANDTLRTMMSYGHYDGLPTDNNPVESPGMAYSMHTEAATFTNFMIYLLNQKGLSASAYETMMQRHSDYKLDPGEVPFQWPTYMGISLEIRETPYGKSFGHGGNNGDFKCKFEVYKDKGMGYAIFTNSNTSEPLLEVMRDFLVEGKVQ